MDNLDSLLYDETDILERLDEYSLYCRYLGFSALIGGKYSSPLRPNDTDPSFGLFERKYGYGPNEFLWKDQGMGVHGDIFDLVARIYNCSRRQGMMQVCADGGIGGASNGSPALVAQEPEYTSDISIRIKSKQYTYRDKAYWYRYHVDQELLRFYNTYSLKAYWLVHDQQQPSTPKGLGFAYAIWDKYQLYFPGQEKRRKFRNNWTEICVPGFLQLDLKQNEPVRPLLIVTKAMKDVICLRSFGYEAVAPRGENILLPELCTGLLSRKYKRVVTLFDNDGKHKAAEYPFQELHVPLASGEKDITDYCYKFGFERTAGLLTQILSP